MMSEWQQQQQPQQQQAPTAAPSPLPQGGRVDTMPDGHGIGGTSGGRRLQLDFYHFVRTIPGILKLVEIVFAIVCIACAAPAYHAATHWFLFVTVTAMLVTFLWIIVYLFVIKEAITLPWSMIEFAYLAFTSLLYFTAFVSQLAIWGPLAGISTVVNNIVNSNIAAGCFGLFNFLAYAAHTFFAFTEFRQSGTRSTNNP